MCFCITNYVSGISLFFCFVCAALHALFVSSCSGSVPCSLFRIRDGCLCLGCDLAFCDQTANTCSSFARAVHLNWWCGCVWSRILALTYCGLNAFWWMHFGCERSLRTLLGCALCVCVDCRGQRIEPSWRIRHRSQRKRKENWKSCFRRPKRV